MKLIKNYLYSHLDLIVFSMLLMVYDLMLRFFCGLTLGKLPIIVNFLILFVIYGALSLIPMVIRKPLEIVLLLLAGIYVFAQTLHYEFFNILTGPLRKLSISTGVQRKDNSGLRDIIGQSRGGGNC